MFTGVTLPFTQTARIPCFTKVLCTATKLVQRRHISSSSEIPVRTRTPDQIPPEAAFHRLSTPTLVRSVILGAIFKRPWLFKPGLKFMKRIADSKSWLLDADRNPAVRAVLLPLIYKQFCAGRNKKEINETIASIKKMGYTGIILCYAREITVNEDVPAQSRVEGDEASIIRNINVWREGTLETLEAIGKGDYIGVKLTGADVSISADLAAERPMRADFLAALDLICQRAKDQGKCLWIDAEEQLYHPAIDNIAIHFMRKYNTDGQAVVLNTIQAYLKTARQNLEWQLRIAKQENWALGIKLVRGAYIASEHRELIHDTKADTDASYDGIVHDIMTQQWPGVDKKDLPTVKLFVAGHNQTSVRKAYSIATDLYKAGKLSTPVEFGQIQGIADDIGCELLEKCEQGKDAKACIKTFQCLSWGSIKECMHYLVRRAIENQGAAERLRTSHSEMVKELRKRLLWG